MNDLLFEPDSTLLALSGRGLFALDHPYTGTWTDRESFGHRSLYRASTGTFFATQDALTRSGDGGFTWTFALADVDAVIELPPESPTAPPALVAVGSRMTGAARSTDDGLTWTPVADQGPPLDALFLRRLAYAPASPNRSQAVLVGAGFGGAAYSTDGGRSWTASNLAQFLGFDADHVIYSAAHDRFFAGINGAAPDGGEGVGLVWASGDGATWTFQGRVPTLSGTPVELVMDPDGVLWSYRRIDDSVLYSSSDEGVTWEERAVLDGEALTGIEGNFLKVNTLKIGPEGRLWAGTSGPPGGGASRGAVLRSVAPVVVSAAQETVPEAAGVELGVPYPNPAVSAVTVPLVLAETAVVRVAVYDLLGRVVATLAEGRTPAGGHLLALDTSALAAGTYVVRAVTPHATQTQRLTITR